MNQFNYTVWSTVFHNGFGPCHTFDLSKAEEFDMVKYMEIGRPGIHFVPAVKSTWEDAHIILHTR